jgi:hypothetical protein
MDYIFCQNCGGNRGFKRSLGFGTFFMFLLTFGVWILAVPLYPKRCIGCGQTKGDALYAQGRRSHKLAVALVLFALFLVWRIHS